MRIIAIIIPLMWGTVIFGHGKEKHEPKIIDDHKMDNTSQKLIHDEGERLNSVNDKENITKTNVVAETVKRTKNHLRKLKLPLNLKQRGAWVSGWG